MTEPSAAAGYRFTDEEQDLVVIIAVEHMREEPDKWRGRLLEADVDET